MPGNGLESIPPEIFELRNLQSLDLSENTIGVVDGKMLRSFAALEELNLGHNLLAELNGVVLPKSLRILNVQNNQVLKSPRLINR